MPAKPGTVEIFHLLMALFKQDRRALESQASDPRPDVAGATLQVADQISGEWDRRALLEAAASGTPVEPRHRTGPDYQQLGPDETR